VHLRPSKLGNPILMTGFVEPLRNEGGDSSVPRHVAPNTLFPKEPSMIRRPIVLATAGLIALAIAIHPQQASAQDGDESDSPFGVGFQSSWPSYGLSGVYDMTDQVTLQAVVGLLGTVSNLAGRGLFRFQQNEGYDVFGFGTVGLWRYSAGIVDESVIGVGGGGGVELDWGALLKDEDDSIPPIFTTIEIGLVLANFDRYNFSALSIGGGIHYRF
jgi:hypothetical protein